MVGMDEQEDLAAEITEYTSLLRARLVGETEDSEEMQLWTSVYGRVTVEGDTEEEVLHNMGGFLQRKLNVSTIIAAHLVARMAALEDRTILQVIDDLEDDILGPTRGE